MEILTAEEYYILCRVVKKTGTDCWCSIRIIDTDDEGILCGIYDVENDKTITFEEAIRDILEALDCPEAIENCKLTPEGVEIWNSLVKRIMGGNEND